MQIHQDFNELTHDVWEAGNTDKQNDCGEYSLQFTLRVVVTKTDCWQSGEDEVDHDDQPLRIILLLESIVVIESKLRCIICGDLGHDVPDGSQEVRQDQNENDQTDDSEDVHEDNLVHNSVIVLFVILLLGGVTGDAGIQIRSESGLDNSLENLSVQDDENLLDTKKSQDEQKTELIFVPPISE